MRLFIAVALDDPARETLARAARAMRRIADGRYVPKEMYHVTLAFLGEIEPGRLIGVQRAMDAAARRAAPVPLALSRPGTFGRGESAILYCGVSGAEGLVPVAERLRGELAARDLPFDPKPFKAHITLARRVNAVPEVLETQVPRAEFPAEGLTLFHSTRVEGVLSYLPIYFSKFEGVKE